MKSILIILILSCISKGIAMQSSFTIIEPSDEESYFLIETKTMAADKVSSIVLKIWGKSIMVISKVVGDTIEQEDRIVKIGERLELVLPSLGEAQSDEALDEIKIKNELTKHEIKLNTKYIYMHPSHFFPYDKDSELIKKLNKKVK